MRLTVAVPVHDMQGGEKFLARLLDSLWTQTFQDFEIVVTDNSEDDRLMRVCTHYDPGIRWYRNPNRGMAPNTNEAIRRSSGNIVKILYMDDYLHHEKALENLVGSMTGMWAATGCVHTITGEEMFNVHYPKYSHDIHMGNNTIGSPSVIAIRNEAPLMFDETLSFLLDCDYYRRMYDEYGPPNYVHTLTKLKEDWRKDVGVVIGLHEGQVSNVMPTDDKLREFEYMTKKYAQQ